MMLLHAMRSKQIFLRVAGATLFILAGGWLALLSLIASSLLPVPGFWCIPCFWAFIPVGLLWGWRPSSAAALSVGPLGAAAAALPSQSGICAVVWAGCLAVAAILVLLAWRDGRGWKTPLVISFAFVASAFCADRLLTNTVTVKTFPMGVSVNHQPWNPPEIVYPGKPLLLYRRIGPIYCMLRLHSPELRNRLAGRRIVPVEFNVVSDFGRPKSYTMRSVVGMPVKQGEYEIFTGGQLEGDGCPLLLFQHQPVEQQLRGPEVESVPRTCPLTKTPPTPLAPSAFVPPEPYPIEPDYPKVFQYGTDKLWVELPKSGTWSWEDFLTDNYELPVPFWRMSFAWGRKGYDRDAEPQPKLKVTGRRLDAPAALLGRVQTSLESVFDGPQPPPMMDSTIDLPSLGCWEITGQYDDDKLTFVIWVTDPPKPPPQLDPFFHCMDKAKNFEERVKCK